MAAETDRNLLFGLLGLQNGLIDQDQLLSAFRAWSLDKARPLAGHLVGRGDLNEAQRCAIDVVVGLHLEKHGGDAQKSLAAIPTGRSARESLGPARPSRHRRHPRPYRPGIDRGRRR